jgi:hypothetical protein
LQHCKKFFSLSLEEQEKGAPTFALEKLLEYCLSKKEQITNQGYTKGKIRGSL